LLFNSDGKLDEGELLSLSEAGVRSLNTTYSNSNEVDSSNNAHKQQGSFTTTAGTDNKSLCLGYQFCHHYYCPSLLRLQSHWLLHYPKTSDNFWVVLPPQQAQITK
jgi:hypothetical protein